MVTKKAEAGSASVHLSLCPQNLRAVRPLQGGSSGSVADLLNISLLDKPSASVLILLPMFRE